MHVCIKVCHDYCEVDNLDSIKFGITIDDLLYVRLHTSMAIYVYMCMAYMRPSLLPLENEPRYYFKADYIIEISLQHF